MPNSGRRARRTSKVLRGNSLTASKSRPFDLIKTVRTPAPLAARALSLVKFHVGYGGVRQFLVEAASKRDAAAQELRPRRHGDLGGERFGQQLPQLRMKPAQVVARAVAVLANTRS